MPNSAHKCYEANLYMPVIAAPPAGTAPEGYYAQLAANGVAVTAVPAADHDGLHITVTSPPLARQSIGDPPTPVPFSTVFAMAGGFVTYYPDDKPFTLPNGDTLPASTSPAVDIGTVVLNIWGADFQQIDQRLFPDEPRPMTFIYRGMQKSKVALALTDDVKNIKRRALVKSWDDTPAHGPAPSDMAALQQAHLARVMAGDGAVFIDGGTPIGEAAAQSTPSQSVAKFTLHSFRISSDGGVTLIPPTSLILALDRNNG